jgi:hypothetical protein
MSASSIVVDSRHPLYDWGPAQEFAKIQVDNAQHERMS